MTARKRPEDKEKAGRPTNYHPKYCDIVRAALRLHFDMTDVDIAELFGVATSTLYNWQIAHPEFLEAIKEGKEGSNRSVAQSLYHRAMGYSHPDVALHVIKDATGQQQIVKTSIVKNYPPDTTAAIFWLKNRASKSWRDKQEVEHTGNMTVSLSKDDAGAI